MIFVDDNAATLTMGVGKFDGTEGVVGIGAGSCWY